MTKQDLKKLSKQQLEEVLLCVYYMMDKKSKLNKEMANKIYAKPKSSPYITPKILNAPEDPGYMVTSSVLRNMCNLINFKIKTINEP